MIRPVLTELALFLTPFVLYALFLYATKEGVFLREHWSPKMVASLTIAALVLMIGSFLVLANLSGETPGRVYVPAHFDQQGNFVPGQWK